MKKLFFISMLILPLLAFSGCGNQSQSNIGNFEVSRTGVVSNTENNNNTTQNEENKKSEEPEKPAEPVETTLFEFSTQIKTKSSNRLTNIQLTCSSLNGATVDNGAEFSFCNTVGKASSDRGFKDADVIINKRVVQAIGGGMCQVSSTLYNTVLGIPNLEVTERHSHDKPVNYVESGKDATISYGSLDFKFVNNTGNQIKIYANADDGNVNVKIVSIS